MIPYEGQSLVDICIQQYADIEKLFELASSNNRALSAEFNGTSDVVGIDPAQVRPIDRVTDRQQTLKVAQNSQTIIYAGQNIPDIALQEYGSVEGLFQLLIDNDLAADSDFVPGTMLKIQASKVRKDVVEFYQRIRFKVNTSAPVLDQDTTGEFNEDYSNDFNT